eukprot:6180924-Heterocapsa_arctica.AAC.1
MHEDDADRFDDEARRVERKEWNEEAASAAMNPSTHKAGQRAAAANTGRVRFAPEPATTEAAGQLGVSSPVALVEERLPPKQPLFSDDFAQQTSPLTATLGLILDDLVLFSRDICGDLTLAAAASAFPLKISAYFGTLELH